MTIPTPFPLDRRVFDGTVSSATCRWCGIDVDNPDPATVGMTRVGGTLFWTTLCDGKCAKRRARAEEIVAAHPILRQAHRDVAVDRLDAALVGLEFAGFATWFSPDDLTTTDDGLLALIEVMAPIGAATAWAASETSQSGPRWAHAKRHREVAQTEDGKPEIGDDGKPVIVVIDHARRARDAYRGLWERRLEVPTACPPPEGADLRGCAFCGLGALIVEPSKAAAAWGPEFRVPLFAIGGRDGSVTAHLCPEDRRAFRAMGGAWGMPAVDRALLENRGYTPTAGLVVSLNGLARAWAARRGATPNTTEWGHLDLATVDRELRMNPYIRRRDEAARVVGYLDLTGAVDERRR